MTKQQISNVILFYSKFSKDSIACVKTIKDLNLPIDTIVLDSSRSRELAKNGKIFQIRNVPALVVEYESGDVQVFTGRPKILKWVDKIINTQSKTPDINVEEEEDIFLDVPEEEIDPVEIIIDDTPEPILSETKSTGLSLGTERMSKPKNNVHKMAEEMKKARDNIVINNNTIPS